MPLKNICWFYQNVMLPNCLLPRYPITKMFDTKSSYFRNVLLPKCPVTEMSSYRNVCYQNVHYHSVLYQNVQVLHRIEMFINRSVAGTLSQQARVCLHFRS